MMEKFKKALKKEFLIYLATLAILIIIAHSDILSNPSERLGLMAEKENFTHPFIYSFVIYAVIFILKKLIDFVSSLFEKKAN